MASLVIPKEIMEQECNETYVEKLVAQNNIKPNPILEPKVNRKPKKAADMEK